MTLLRKLWICERCFALFELDAGRRPARDDHRHVLCRNCTTRPAPGPAHLDQTAEER